MALDQAARFEKELQLLFMQTGKIDVWNKIKARSQSMDLEAAHEARREKEAAAKRKKEIEETTEIVIAVFLAIVALVGMAWGLYELMQYCQTSRSCSR
jgi:uncharacterized ion transporter superfamily protein YfcC